VRVVVKPGPTVTVKPSHTPPTSKPMPTPTVTVTVSPTCPSGFVFRKVDVHQRNPEATITIAVCVAS
jgi:hypothetical protein